MREASTLSKLILAQEDLVWVEIRSSIRTKRLTSHAGSKCDWICAYYYYYSGFILTLCNSFNHLMTYCLFVSKEGLD